MVKEEEKFISLLADTTFKYMFKDDNCRGFFEKLIKLTTNIDIKGYELYNNEINSGNNNRDYRLDILLKKDNDFIIIEMNSFLDKGTLLKNRMYLYNIAGGGLEKGEEFKKMKAVLINFNNNSYKDNRKAISVCYDFNNDLYNDVIDDIKMYDIYLESLDNVRYNGSNEKETYLAMFRATSFNEMRFIANNHKEALKIVEELERLSEDDEFRTRYDAEKIHRKLVNTARHDGYDDGVLEGIMKGKEEGSKVREIEIAKNLLNIGVPTKDIIEATGLSTRELNELIS